MNPAINLTTGILPTAQIPLDAKGYFKTVAEMQDLGQSNFRAFYYFDSMIVVCVENRKQYIWRKRITILDVGVLPQDFVYPNGIIANDIDYSNQAYNFFIYKPNEIQLSNRIISGGQISWEGGLTYYVAELVYLINNAEYSALADTVTFAAGDDTYDRFDAIVVDVAGNILILPGQPAEIPAQPIVNNNLYCLITYVRINAGQTVANIVKTIVYDENTGLPAEFDTGASVLEDFTFDSPDFSNTNNLCIYFKGIGENQPLKTFRFRKDTLLNFVDYDTLEFYIQLQDPNFENPNFLSLVLKNSVSETESDRLVIDANYNFNNTLSDVYQRIIIPINDIQNSPVTFDIIEFVITDGDHVPFRFDTVSLFSGIPNDNNQLQGFLELTDVFENTYVGKAGYKARVNGTETGMVLTPGTVLQSFTATADQTDFPIPGSPATLALVLTSRTAPIPDVDYTYANGILSFEEGLIVGTLVRVFADLDALPINAPNENAVEILKTKISLTADQINNIGTTPVEVISSPGAGKALFLISGTAKLNFNTTAFDNNSFQVTATSGSTPLLNFFNILNKTTNWHQPAVLVQGEIVENDSFQIVGTDSVAVGDSTLDIYLTYEIITL